MSRISSPSARAFDAPPEAKALTLKFFSVLHRFFTKLRCSTRERFSERRSRSSDQWSDFDSFGRCARQHSVKELIPEHAYGPVNIFLQTQTGKSSCRRYRRCPRNRSRYRQTFCSGRLACCFSDVLTEKGKALEAELGQN